MQLSPSLNGEAGQGIIALALSVIHLVYALWMYVEARLPRRASAVFQLRASPGPPGRPGSLGSTNSVFSRSQKTCPGRPPLNLRTYLRRV